jgi:hypothetical protein
MPITIEEAKAILSTCKREEVRNYSFGDTTVYWIVGNKRIAMGYYNSYRSSVYFYDSMTAFDGEDARLLASYSVATATVRQYLRSLREDDDICQ